MALEAAQAAGSIFQDSWSTFPGPGGPAAWMLCSPQKGRIQEAGSCILTVAGLARWQGQWAEASDLWGSEAIAPSDLCGGTQHTALEKGAQV